MDQQRLHTFEGQCVQEEPPACQTSCPLHVDARTFAGLMAAQKIKDARRILDRAMPLSGLTGHLCHGACLASCTRARVDAPVNIPLLEKACLIATQSAKPMPMPETSKKIAVAGSGLSSLAFAWEIAKKGHPTTIFCPGRQGGTLADLPPHALPPQALEEAFSLLAALRVSFIPASKNELASLLASAEYDAVYLGFDDPALPQDICKTGLEAPTQRDSLTLETSVPHIFAGGLSGSGFIFHAADGKRAAGSVNRLFQGVAPGTAREKEGVYPTRLFTDISGVTPQPQIIPGNQGTPTVEEASSEAGRCIQCQCLECVKQCPYLAFYRGYPKKSAREIYNNLAVVQGLRQANTMINSCAQCGLCAVVCPNHVDMGEFCAEARQEMVASNRMPPSAHEFALEDMEYSNAPDIACIRHQPGYTASGYLFFPGCQLPASLPKQTADVYSHLCTHLQGGIGFMLRCCGAPAKWSGRRQLTERVRAELLEQWVSFGKPKIIVACASCLLFFQEELPEITCLSLWPLLAKLPLPSSARAWKDTTLALHDPCAARHDQQSNAAVRAILRQLEQPLHELPMREEKTRCCGYGGLAAAANPSLGILYAEARTKETDLPLASYCIMCRDRLHQTGRPGVHVLDLLFPSASPAVAASRPSPGISNRQTARRAFRNLLLHTLWHENGQAEQDSGIALHISDELAQQLEDRCILHSDIRQVLEYAQQHGALFCHPESEKKLAALRPRQVTIWVEYTTNGNGGYDIHDAYAHRMVVPGVPGEGLPSPCTLEGYAAKGGRL